MSDMTISYRQFPFGTQVPGTPPQTTYSLSQWPSPAVPAPPQEPPAPATAEYVFEFWDIDGQTYFTPDASPPGPVPSEPFAATAWYFGGGGKFVEEVFTYAFSLDKNGLMTGQTPIGSVNGAPWTSQSTEVPTNASKEVIIAKPMIAGFGNFVSWFQVGGAAISGSTLTAPKGSDIHAVAFYKLPPSGTITGTVQEDTEGGMFGLAGATIVAQPGGSTKSGAGGAYVLTLPPGPVELTASAPNCTQFHANLTVVVGEIITQDIVLTRLRTSV